MSRMDVGSFDAAAEPVSNQIRGSEKGTLAGAWLGTVIPVIMIVWIFWGSHMPFFLKPGMPNPFIILLGLVEALLVTRAIWETLRIKRFGDPILELTEAPVPMEGTLDGRITLGPGVVKAPEFTARLQCIHRTVQNTGKGQSISEKVLCSSEAKASMLPGGIVPVSIPVPSGGMETSFAAMMADRILWRLTVRAPFPGPDFLEKYEIPVRGKASRSRERDPSLPDNVIPDPVQSAKGRMFFAVAFFFLMVVPLAGFGFYLMTHAIAGIQTAQASTTWPTVAGRISHSERGESSIFGQPRIQYAYSVNGTGYSGTIVSPHWFWSRLERQKIVALYRDGATTQVHYAPDNPRNSVLEPGVRPGSFQPLVCSTLVLSLALLIGATVVCMPKYGVTSGNTIYLRKGSPAEKITKPVLLLIVAQLIALWLLT